MTKTAVRPLLSVAFGLCASLAALAQSSGGKPNVVVLMSDDTGWLDLGAYTGGGGALGHPTPNLDRLAKEGALFTSWYGQASCTAGRASFKTRRIPIRSPTIQRPESRPSSHIRPAQTGTVPDYRSGSLSSPHRCSA